MRTLKFRAWEKTLNEMITITDINFESRLVNTNGLWRGFEEVVLMQSTGLHDANGLEIFEGDIYQTTGDYVETYKVWYDVDRAGFFPFATDDGCGCCTVEVIFLPGESGNVIGNIFENPDLLLDEVAITEDK